MVTGAKQRGGFTGGAANRLKRLSQVVIDALAQFGNGNFIFKIGKRAVGSFRWSTKLISTRYPFLPLTIKVRLSNRKNIKLDIQGVIDTAFSGDIAIPCNRAAKGV